MEKLIYTLWRNARENRDNFNAQLLTNLPVPLLRLGAQKLCINVQDEDVRAGEVLRQTWQTPQPDALLQFWLPSAYRPFRQKFDHLIGKYCGRFAAWCVTESEIIVPTRTWGGKASQRLEGWSQIALIGRPDPLSHAQWISEWQDRHTQVAIETQSNFAYWQNAVTRSLSDKSPPYAAIVEECFPVGALTDPLTFFDAAGDRAKFEANLDRMMRSCARFIDPAMIDVMPTSRYEFGDL